MTATSQTKSHSCQSTEKSVYVGEKKNISNNDGFFFPSPELKMQSTGLPAGLGLTIYWYNILECLIAKVFLKSG